MPTQAASHVQKNFIRLNSMNKDRRRSSIHDITSVNNGDISAPQGPITGQANGSAAGVSPGKAAKQPPQHPAGPLGVGMYGPSTVGQPIGGPLVLAVGTRKSSCPSSHGIWCWSPCAWSSSWNRGSWCTNEHGSYTIFNAAHNCSWVMHAA